MMNNTGKLSIVAICVCVRCMQSSVMNRQQSTAGTVFLVICFASRYIPGSIRIPAKAPANLQPKGVIPKTATAKLIRTFPSGG